MYVEVSQRRGITSIRRGGGISLRFDDSDEEGTMYSAHFFYDFRICMSSMFIRCVFVCHDAHINDRRASQDGDCKT